MDSWLFNGGSVPNALRGNWNVDESPVLTMADIGVDEENR